MSIRFVDDLVDTISWEEQALNLHRKETSETRTPEQNIWKEKHTNNNRWLNIKELFNANYDNIMMIESKCE